MNNVTTSTGDIFQSEQIPPVSLELAPLKEPPVIPGQMFEDEEG
ncbi:MAG TPA: hypothetical protein VE544_06895 [Nitrososphaeraceae archaeon]|nr:hypothetical protein [Nitrososphaeraceae archaeon]